MTETLPAVNGNQETTALLEQVVVQGDLAKLSPADRLAYYRRVCESLKLNPLTQPFMYISLQGKLTLYARKDATDQLRAIHGISVSITSREKMEDLYVVTARATTRDGRTDEAIGAVSITGLRGEALANALMKAETKAKRRVSLCICGLGWTDESEIDSIPNAQPVRVDETTGEILDRPALPPGAKVPIPVEEAYSCAVCKATLTEGQSRLSIKAFDRPLCILHHQEAKARFTEPPSEQAEAAKRAASQRAKNLAAAGPAPSEREQAKLDYGKLCFRAQQAKVKLPGLAPQMTLEEIREMHEMGEAVLAEAEAKASTSAEATA